jgi:hypothetical protein
MITDILCECLLNYVCFLFAHHISSNSPDIRKLTIDQSNQQGSTFHVRNHFITDPASIPISTDSSVEIYPAAVTKMVASKNTYANFLVHTHVP